MKHLSFKMVCLISFFFAVFTINTAAQNNFVYTNNNASPNNSVTAFSVGPDGALTQVPGSPFATGGKGDVVGASSSRILTSGTFLFVCNASSGDVSVFSINTTAGVLTPVPGSPFSTGEPGGAIAMGVTPDNRFLFLSHFTRKISIFGTVTISTFSIAPNGALTLLPRTMPITNTPDTLRVSPDGRSLFVTMQGIDSVTVFSIGANGELTVVPGSPFFTAAFGSAAGIDVSCASDLLLVVGGGVRGTNIDVFSIAPNGVLTPVPGSPFNNPDVADLSQFVVLSRDERFLFVSNRSASVTVFAVGPSGALSLVPGSPFPTGDGNSAGLAINATGTLLYVTNFDNSTVTVFSISSNGLLNPVPGSPFITGQPSFSGLFSLTAFPAKSCPSVFDIRLQDDGNGNLLMFNTSSGDYQFTNCRKGITLAGRGKITRPGGADSCKLELNDSGPDPKRPDRKVSVLVNLCTLNASASISIFSLGQTFTITDTNFQNNSNRCP